MWEHQLNGLSTKRRVITFDLPGFGKTPPLQEEEGSMGAYADAIFSFLDEKGVEKAIFAGCSMGGYILFEMWRRASNRFAGLILSDTRAEADTKEAREKRSNTIDEVRSNGAVALAGTMTPNLLGPETLEKRKELVEKVHQTIQHNSPIGIIHALQAMAARPDSSDLLKEISVPTLILVGKDDLLTPPDLARSMKEAIPHSHLEIIPQAGHLAPLEQPKKVNQAILKWLERGKI